MEDTSQHPSLPDDVNKLKRLLVVREDQLAQRDHVIAEHQKTITQHQSTIAALTQQRDTFHLEKLRLEVRLTQALKQAYGPRADRLRDPGQLLLDFGGLLDALTIEAADPPVEPDDAESSRRASRRLRTRGRRDIGSLDHLPLIEQTYELPHELCQKGLPGPGLLAYVVTAKFGDSLPLHRLQHIFARQGFELDRSTMCLWLADVARLVTPVYNRMVRHVLQSHVLATDDTVLPLLHPGKTKHARMWIYQGDDDHPYNVFAFTESRKRDGPTAFLKDFRGALLADAYGGYDGIVLEQDLPRAGCWAHARRKFVDHEKAAPPVARAILKLINRLFDLEKRLPVLGSHATAEERAAAADERLRRRQAKAVPLLDTLHALLVEQKAKLLPKHPLAEAIGYTLNQWRELTLFTTDPAVPIHNHLAEQQMKRIALLRKNALFAGSPRGGETAAILSSLTNTCRRHAINPQAYLTQLLANLPDTPISRVDEWLPDRWKEASETPPAPPADASPAEN